MLADAHTGLRRGRTFLIADSVLEVTGNIATREKYSNGFQTMR